jgi:hypothetical protein
MACGACHIAYKPDNPPADADHPAWENIDALVGNQYSRISNLLGSGLSPHRLEWQLIARARPGLVDTSALPMDFVSNPGTMNAIINFARRPLHENRILKWRKASACAAADPQACWCEPGREGKCWEKSLEVEMVPAILKGGEDSIGYNEAIQRVYFNIGSCAEQCWINHLTDLRAADPEQRNYGQTPFDVGQCRRDCAAFRAIEDRLDDIRHFFLTARPTDLWRARGLASPRDLEVALDAEFFPGAVEQGRQVFVANCARCHSSQEGTVTAAGLTAVDPADPTLRLDWLGNDEIAPASEVGTYPGRSLHSNHMAGRVWAEYASLTEQARPADPLRPEVLKSGGRGYYRNISLLSAWAHAPFMHNNAIGPEICGKPSRAEVDFYSSPYVDAQGKPVADPPACLAFDPSVEGRYALYRASMEEMLHPEARVPKMFILDRDIVIDIAPKVSLLGRDLGLSLTVPAGFPAADVNSLRYKDMVQDLVLVARDPAAFEAKYAGLLTDAEREELREGLIAIRAQLLGTATISGIELVLNREEAVVGRVQDLTLQVGNDFVQRYYSNLLEHREDAGHRFGEGLSERDKQALIAFVATL